MRKGNPSDVRQGLLDAVLQRGLGAVRGARDARARASSRTRSTSSTTSTATIFRAARIVVDTSLHLGEMTFDEAVAFMQDKAALPEPVARAEVGRYCWWPTQASSYLTGCLEILAIRERYLAARGFAGVAPKDVPIEVLREFHDAIASLGRAAAGPRRSCGQADAAASRRPPGSPDPAFR